MRKLYWVISFCAGFNDIVVREPIAGGLHINANE